jgi:farnesyl-diphosphate farnesyltransferase
MRGPSRSDSLATDREWTFEVVGSVSRTFALSIDLLEEPVASWVCTGYLLCRTADTVEDDPAMSPRDRADILDTYAAALDPDDAVDVEEFLAAVEEVRGRDGDGDGDTDTDPDRGDDWAVLDCADRTFRVYESFDPAVRTAMREVTREMADGMAGFLRRHADAGGLRLGTVDELEEYCWYVAGTVGKLFTRLLNCYGTDVAADRDSEDARAFALLLQLVNIAKDVRRDDETENNVYLPGEWLAEEGLTHDTVGDPAHAEALARVVERVVDRAPATPPVRAGISGPSPTRPDCWGRPRYRTCSRWGRSGSSGVTAARRSPARCAWSARRSRRCTPPSTAGSRRPNSAGWPRPSAPAPTAPRGERRPGPVEPERVGSGQVGSNRVRDRPPAGKPAGRAPPGSGSRREPPLPRGYRDGRTDRPGPHVTERPAPAVPGGA